MDPGFTGQPAYLSDSMHNYQPARNLRSASTLLLQQPPVTTVFSSRAFPVAAPSVWHSPHIGLHTHSAETFLTFKSRLKTVLTVHGQLRHLTFQRHHITALLIRLRYKLARYKFILQTLQIRYEARRRIQGLPFEAIDRSLSLIDRLNTRQAIDFSIAYTNWRITT